MPVQNLEHLIWHMKEKDSKVNINIYNTLFAIEVH